MYPYIHYCGYSNCFKFFPWKKNDSILLYFGGFHLIEFFDLMFMGALVELCVCERNANAYHTTNVHYLLH